MSIENFFNGNTIVINANITNSQLSNISGIKNESKKLVTEKLEIVPQKITFSLNKISLKFRRYIDVDLLLLFTLKF